MTKVVGVLLVVGAWACAAGGESSICQRTSDCSSDLVCVSGTCVARQFDSGIMDLALDSRLLDAGNDIGAVDANVPGSDMGPDGSDVGVLDAGDDARAPDAGPACGEGCTGWVLTSGVWSTFNGTGFAPSLPVRAAFDVPDTNIAYVLTDTTFHILRLTDREFTAAGNRDTLLPEIAGTPLVSATSNAGSAIISSAAISTIYRLESDMFVFDRQVSDFGDDWSGPNAPSRRLIQGAWRSSGNADWVSDSATCMVDGPYWGFIAPGRVHPRDFGTCRKFLDPVPYSEFRPFSLVGAPPVEQIGAAFYNNNSLWILKR